MNQEIRKLYARIETLEKENNILANGNSSGLDLFSHSKDGILIFDSEETIVDVNPSFAESIKMDKQQLIGRSLCEIVPENKHFKLEKQKELLKKNNSVRGILPVYSGTSIIEFDFATSTLNESGLFMCILRDVTSKRRLERKVKKNEELYADLFIEALDGIIFWCSNGEIIDANEAACRIFECTHDELIKRQVKDFVYEKSERYRNIVKEMFIKGSIRDELVFLMPNGQFKSLEFTVKLNSVEGYHMTIFRNVSERHAMEKSLRESEQKFRMVFEGALEGILLWNDQFQIVDINQSGQRMLQMSKEDLVGISLHSILNDCNITDDELKEQIRSIHSDGQSDGNLSITLKSGRKKFFEFSNKLNIFSNISMTTFKDITEKLEMEEQLRKSDTLNVIGELAAGIAHEIRNPMTALKGFIQLLEGSVKEDHTMYFNVITTELSRIDSIINEFLILAKPQAVKFVEKDISQIMKETVDLLSAQAVLHNVQFRTYYEQNLPRVFCESNQMKKVFINIIKNAIEVMPKGGYITVSIQKESEQRVHISIGDEGTGIPAHKIKKLGEPFYTTKERGTGLGLMVTYKIIEEHKGTIEVESKLGEGTVFHIYLPI
ncbi:PAS domain-containing sensor histidine kinase [Cytobacillus firmus]|uniref:histidine kinase n=1 Tax=Cytobacillus firmus TaxID=1399 RepID=A0AA46Q680_CYTFI|nr:PAS domain-containing sensor histidine kinase [Cytobacillus firmus]MCS0652052.1 PAS domain S-box protein [Cytobacillus firmus]UYG97844.1 PAS domain S-box protein [Cytobacillus firmus]WHY36679.1 PAS domain S-box protein [Cytobacillus firmus]